jgi:hypothetical protein
MAKSIVGKILEYVNPVVPVERVLQGIPRYNSFWKDYRRYKEMAGVNGSELTIMPSIHEKDDTHEFDAHYQYQPLWALKKISAIHPAKHIDVGSQLNFGLTLSLNTPVEFIDLRKLNINWPNYTMKAGSILDLPYETNSIDSLSCMHVIEHIGLGRYGDPLNPNGSIEAAKELSRVVKSGGNFFLTTPVGKAKVAFNSHRIHTTKDILNMFNTFKLISFDVINDEGNYVENVYPSVYDTSRYACGLFHFQKL